MVRRVLSAAASLLFFIPLHAHGQGSSAPPAVRLSGYLQARETYQDEIGFTGAINRARLAAAGTVQEGISWRIQGEFRTGNVGTGRASVSLQDAYVRWTRKSLYLQAGQFKTPFTREFITSLTEVETADRSTVVDSLAPKRDIGLLAEYALGGRATFSAGVFNGNGQNVSSNPDSALLGIARVSVRPVPFVSVGVNAARYFADSSRYGADVNLEAPWLVLRGEWVGQHRDAADTEDDEGWFALAAVPALPWLQPIAKVESFDRPSVTDGSQKNRAWTLGANIFPWGRATRFTFEYVSRKVGTPGVRRGVALAQAQVVF